MTEIWKPIVGWERFYEVSSEGRVRSLRSRGGRTHRILKPGSNPQGYQIYILCVETKKAGFTAQNLVMTAFKGTRPDGLQIDHIDGDKKNNRVSNLRYVTQSENLKSAFRLGLMVQPKGEKSCRAKLTDDEVRELKVLLEKKRRGEIKTSNRALAEPLGVSQQCIEMIYHGRTWSHIKPASS